MASDAGAPGFIDRDPVAVVLEQTTEIRRIDEAARGIQLQNEAVGLTMERRRRRVQRRKILENVAPTT